jgi:hypothetical protein
LPTGAHTIQGLLATNTSTLNHGWGGESGAGCANAGQRQFFAIYFSRTEEYGIEVQTEPVVNVPVTLNGEQDASPSIFVKSQGAYTVSVPDTVEA